jgi:hypothetical protein
MDRIFLDINVFQDILSARQGYDASVFIIELVRQGKMKGFCSALTIPILWYLNRKMDNQREKLRILLKGFSIIALTLAMIKKTLSRHRFGDLEDEIQYLSAQKSGSKILITRNIADFPKHPLQLFTPEKYLENLED